MVHHTAFSDADAPTAQPIVHTIGPRDLREALVKGLADFEAMPTHLIFLCAIYPILMLVIARLYAGYDVLPLIFPLIAGYTLIGPLVATGMYELSRRRVQDLDISRAHAFEIILLPSIGAIARLSALLMIIYFVWLGTAWMIYQQTFGGAAPESIMGFALQVFTTPAGWALIFLGCGAGFIIATVARGVLSNACGPGRQRRDGGSNVNQSGFREPDNHGDVGLHRRQLPVDRVLAIFRRPLRRAAGARTRDVAFLSQDCGARRFPSLLKPNINWIS